MLVFLSWFKELTFVLSIAISNPPINDRFRVIAINWRGTKWKIIVVGTKKISSREHASLVLFEKIKRIEPLIKSAIAPINKRLERGSGNPRWSSAKVLVLAINYFLLIST